MARVAAATSRIYLDNFNLSGFANAADLKFDVDLPEVTSFADAAKVHVAGKYGGAVSINAFGDPTAASWDEIAAALYAEDAISLLGVFPGTAAPAAAVGYELQIWNKSIPRSSKVGEAWLLNLEAEAHGAAVRATVLCNAAVTADGAVAAGQNLGATVATTDRFVVVYRVLAVSGAGSITFDVQQSTDDGGGDPYAGISGLTGTFTAVGAQRYSTIAATEAWKRIYADITGFTSVTILATVGVERPS